MEAQKPLGGFAQNLNVGTSEPLEVQLCKFIFKLSHKILKDGRFKILSKECSR